MCDAFLQCNADTNSSFLPAGTPMSLAHLLAGASLPNHEIFSTPPESRLDFSGALQIAADDCTSALDDFRSKRWRRAPETGTFVASYLIFPACGDPRHAVRPRLAAPAV